MTADRFPIRVVVMTLAVLVVGLGVAMVALTIREQPIPDQLDRAFVGALGGFLTLLASTASKPQGGDPALDVTVVNDPGDPVPTVEKKR